MISKRSGGGHNIPLVFPTSTIVRLQNTQFFSRLRKTHKCETTLKYGVLATRLYVCEHKEYTLLVMNSTNRVNVECDSIKKTVSSEVDAIYCAVRIGTHFETSLKFSLKSEQLAILKRGCAKKNSYVQSDVYKQAFRNLSSTALHRYNVSSIISIIQIKRVNTFIIYIFI